jgi:multicomponent Na+:H+ antiporter subunit E
VRLAAPGARVFLANCDSLLPGTLSADLQGDWLTIHTLSSETDSASELGRLARAVTRLFSEDLEVLR